jgi:uncharacterized membrane protein YphA (DoxX/SURF4 family)
MLSYFSMYNNWGVWILQYAVGIIFIVHGWPKIKSKTGLLKIGGPFHGLVEVVGAFALFFSYHTRAVGLVFAVIMLGAIWFKKFKWNLPFYSHAASGWEFDFILLAVNLFFLTR